MRWSLTLLLAASVALAQQKSFVACPIVRDTKTVPCFLAEYDGELYFLGTQPDVTEDFHAPELRHEVLAEGRVVPGPRVCGGIPLQPVSISVMKEVNLACSTMLPPEPGIDAPVVSRSAKATAPLAGPHEFTVLYSFNDDDLAPAVNSVLTDAADYAQRIHASSVKMTGYRATTLLSNGNRMVEKEGLAEKRAQNIAALLAGLGVANVTVEWKAEATPADGRSDPSHRRVSILVTP
ncbi:MAG TPA: hypothetical protein VGN17_06060 [Bryobacteraceae bacterium]|jgi:outer membrane protein OmpA-like peptidoglycan-associated protein